MRSSRVNGVLHGHSRGSQIRAFGSVLQLDVLLVPVPGPEQGFVIRSDLIWGLKKQSVLCVTPSFATAQAKTYLIVSVPAGIQYCPVPCSHSIRRTTGLV
jgi:hypothetical protein